MTSIETQIEINASIDRVWEIISDIDHEPSFWKGTISVKNISTQGNTIQREITIAFKDKKCLQTVTLHPKEKIHFLFTSGIIRGSKTLQISQINDIVKLEAIWDIEFSGMLKMFTGVIKNHVKNGTNQALETIKQHAQNG